MHRPSRRVLRRELLAGLALVVGAATLAPAQTAPAAGEPTRSAAAPADALAADAPGGRTTAPRSSAELVEDVLATLHAGRSRAAWRTLLDGVLAQVSGQAAAAAAAPEQAAGLEVALLLLDDLVAQTGEWSATARALAEAGPRAEALPPRVSFLLDRLQAACLRRLGRADDAREITRQLGYVTDWLVIGPFDNERGSGHDVPYAPEQRLDREAEVPGKERPVAWRDNPHPEHPLGRIDVGALLRPREQVVAYLATAVRAERAGPVVLRLGSTGSFKLLHDGREVAARKVERPLASDQDLLVVPLHEGWNTLLLKLGVEDGPFAAEVRLTDVAGRPLPHEVASARAAWPPQDGTADGAPLADATDADATDDDATDDDATDDDRVAVTSPAPEARDVLAAAAEAGEARAARLLALLHLLQHPDDRTERSARRAAERAVALDPGAPLAHLLLARASEERDADRNEIEVNSRLHALHEVLALDPSHVAALLDLARFSLEVNPLPRRADELSERALAAAPDSWEAHVLRARFLETRRRDVEADALLRRADALEEAGARTEVTLRAVQHELVQGRPAAARERLAAAVAGDVLDGRLADEYVQRLVDDGELPEALEVVGSALAAEPFDLSRRLHAAQRLEQLGAEGVAAATALVDDVLAICPEHAGALADRVRLALAAGDDALAAGTLARLVELEPGDDAARRRLALLTEGEVERFEEPYRWDAAVLASLPLPADAADPLEVLDRTVVWRVQPDGTEHRYEHLALRVLGQGGIAALDVWPLQGPPGSSIHVHGVRVIHPDGRIEHAPPARGRGAWRYHDLPPLAVGDVVDVEYRVDQRQPDVFGEYFGTRHAFHPDWPDEMLPARRSELVVIAPPDVPLHVAERNAERLQRLREVEPDGDVVHRWVATDLPRPPLEVAMPRREELVPVVDVTTFRDWDAFADWWWHFIEKEFVTTPAMREKVAELTAGLDDELARIEAVARFVGQEIRYNAWAFGTHGYEPYSAATIFERRFGDCKDKSILLRQMLAEIGVEAIPVLIEAEHRRADEPLDAAMVGLFNHCIAYLPPTATREGFYLDATADRNPLDYLREDDQGARVLHVTADGGEVHEIPYAPPAQNARRVRYEVVLEADGSGTVTLVDDSNGSHGVRLRHLFGGQQGDARDVLARRLRDVFGPVEVVSVETSDLEDIGQPARLHATFRARDLWNTQGREKGLRLSFDPLEIAGVAAEPPSQRSHPLVLDRPFAHDTEVLWRLPEGSGLARVPEPTRIAAEGLLSYELDVQPTADGLLVRRRFALDVPRVALADYGAFRDALRAIEQAEERTALVSPPATEN